MRVEMHNPEPNDRTLPPRRGWPWLVLGAASIVAANTRWEVGVLGWLTPLALMRFLRISSGWRPRLLLGLILPLAWTLAVMKIVTQPLPLVAAVGFGVPIGLLVFPAYLVWDRLRRAADDWRSVLAFPSLLAAAEWLGARFTGFGSWGAVAYTQIDNLPLLQVASLFGLAGIAWVVYGTAALIDRGLVSSGPARRRWLIAAAATVVVAHSYGFARLATAGRPQRTVLAAAVGTDATFSGLPLPTPDEIERIENALFERTRVAASAGASLAVWTEGATLVERGREPAFLGRAAAAARQGGIELVVSYLVPLSLEPLLYENKYVWLRPSGEIDHTYLKHEPVPGEPAVRGTEPLRVVHTGFGPATGAICYDYDFPYLALRHARLGAGLVALPSSDWQGIDPIHTQMAAVRAIEGGFSIVRSTRRGLSGGIDPYGRLRGWLSANESGQRLLLVTLPVAPVPTLYARIGDALALAGAGFVLWLGAWPLRSRRRAAFVQ